MGGIALPALHLNAPQPPPNPLEQYGQLLQLKNQMANAPLQRKALQQQVQQGQIGLQEAQQGQKDQQTFRAAMADPAMQGKTIGDVADALAKQGAISQPAWIAAKKADVEQRKENEALTDTQLKNNKETNAQLQGIYSNAMQMPPQDFAAAWPTLVQQISHIPGVQKMGLDPSQPMTQDQLSHIGPFLSMHSAYLDDEVARRKAQADAQKAQTDAQISQQTLERGGTTDQDKFTSDYLKSHGMDNTPANRQAAFQEYTRQTKIAPAQVRVEGYAQSREMPVIDTQNGNALQYVSAADINASNKVTPGRYVPAVEGGKALQKTSLVEDIRGNINSVRQNLSNAKMPEFTADQRATIAVAIGGSDPSGALSSALRGGVLGSLTPEQQDYLINMAQLKENAMAMRSVLGAGQGSEDLRSAILATIPGPRNPSKAYGLKQLDAFEKVLDRLKQGVPNVPLAPNRSGQPAQQAAPSGGVTVTAPNGKTYSFKDQASADAFKQKAGIR